MICLHQLVALDLGVNADGVLILHPAVGLDEEAAHGLGHIVQHIAKVRQVALAVVAQGIQGHDLGLFVHSDHLHPKLGPGVRNGQHHMELAVLQVDARVGHPAEIIQVDGAVFQGQLVRQVHAGVANFAAGHGQAVQGQVPGHIHGGREVRALCAADGQALGIRRAGPTNDTRVAAALNTDGAVAPGQDDAVGGGDVLQRQHGVCRIPGVAVMLQSLAAVIPSHKIQLAQRMGALGEGHGGDHQEHDQNTGNEFLHFSPSLSFLCIYFTIL